MQAMARPLRVLVPGGVHHVISRGTERTDLFLDDADRRAFLGILRTVNDRFGFECLSYCLMPNHFHLLLRTREENLSRGIQQLKSRYAQRFNDRYDRVGPLFAERFKAPLVQEDPYLLQLMQYIALNPVRSGLCTDPLAWPWSAHAVLWGARPADGIVDVTAALGFFDAGVEGARASYRRLFGFEIEPPRQMRAAAWGDDEFLRAALPSTRPSDQVPVAQWGPGRPPLDEVVADGTDECLDLAYRTYGYTQAEIARAIGCHFCTVSRRLKRLELERPEE